MTLAMRDQENLEKGRAEGKAEGRAETRRESVKRMLAAGRLSMGEIAEYMGMSVDEVKEIAAGECT